MVISNNENAFALSRAKTNDIPAHFVDHKRPQAEVDAEILALCEQNNIDFIMLLGYIKQISPAVIEKYPIFNIHPALDLHRFGGKSFYGLKVHEAVLQEGETVSGATIHKVDAQYDHGEVLMQTPCVPVQKDDNPETLQKRVLSEEHKLIPQFLKKYTSQSLEKQ